MNGNSEERRRIDAAKRYIEIMRSLDPTQFRADFKDRIDEQEREILERERRLERRAQPA